MGKVKKFLTMILVFVCVLVAGCGKDEAPKEAEGQTAKKEETYETVGNESEDALQVLMTNQTELEIAGMSVKSSQETEYPANMLRNGQTISPDERVMFCYKAEPGKEEAAAGASPQSETDSVLSGAVINVGYSMQVTCVDGTILEATLFPIEDMVEATLCYENDVLYFTYKSKTDESQVSTKEAETVAVNHKRMAISVAEQIQQLGDVTL